MNTETLSTVAVIVVIACWMYLMIVRLHNLEQRAKHLEHIAANQIEINDLQAKFNVQISRELDAFCGLVVEPPKKGNP